MDDSRDKGTESWAKVNSLQLATLTWGVREGANREKKESGDMKSVPVGMYSVSVKSTVSNTMGTTKDE